MKKGIALCCLLWTFCGCEESSSDRGYHHSESSRTVTVKIANYASGYSYSFGYAEIFVGGAFHSTLLSGENTVVYLDLFDDEEIPIKIILYSSNGIALQWEDFFNNNYAEYHVNLYDNYVDARHGDY